MFKKYFHIFFPNNKRKRSTPKNSSFIAYFGEKKSTRKYQKRRKNVFQKIKKRVSIFSNIPSKLIIILLGLGALFVVLFALFYSPYTSISKINVYREGGLIDINRAYGQLDYLRGKNIFSIDNTSIVERLQKSQSAISQIRINKDFPNTININLNSHKVIFQTQQDLILSNGSIIEKENESFPDARFIYLSEDTGEYIDFQKKLRIKELNTIIELIEESSKNILGFTPSEMYYFIKERELLVRDLSGTIYIFDLQQDVDSQIRRLAIFDTESGESQKNSYTYIDIRIPEKLFLCSREEENTCNNNLQQIYGDTIFQNPLPEVSESLQ